MLVIVITGCKLDLEEKRTVTTEEAQALAVENHCEFIECSAKQGKNVTEIFDMVGKLLLARTGEED